MKQYGLEGLLLFTAGVALFGGLMTAFVSGGVIRIARRFHWAVSEGFVSGIPYAAALIVSAAGFLCGLNEFYPKRHVATLTVVFMLTFGLAGLLTGSLLAASILSSRSVKS